MWTKIQTRVQSFEQREVLLQAIFREFIAEIALGKTKPPCRFRLRSIGLRQRLLNDPSLPGRERAAQVKFFRQRRSI
jgi:hypothetical protein